MPHVILFDALSLRGNHKHVVAPEPNLAAPEDGSFNDRTQSFIIIEGNWQFCKDVNFQTPFPGVFGPGAYVWADIQGVAGGTLSSLRPVPQAATTHGDAVSGAITLFEHAGFRGGHRHIFLDTPDLTAADLPAFNDAASSIAFERWSVVKGSVQLCADVSYGRPYPVRLLPGLYSYVGDYGLPNDDLSSLRFFVQQPGPGPGPGVDPTIQGDQAFGALILFEHANFRGSHRHIYQAEPDLGAPEDPSLVGKVSSIWIGWGAWALFSAAGFQRLMPSWNIASFPFDQSGLLWESAEEGHDVQPDAPRLFLPGGLPDVSAFAITNDALRSLCLPLPSVYLITWDTSSDPQSVWLVLVVGPHNAADLHVTWNRQDITSSLTQYHTYADSDGHAFAYAYYGNLGLARGQVHNFAVSCVTQGPYGSTLKTASGTWSTAAPPTTVVPGLVGERLDTAFQTAAAAQVNIGFVFNPSNEIRSDHLMVTNQDLAAGTRVAPGRSINISVSPLSSPSGVSVVHCYNQNNDGKEVHVWTWDGAQWQDKGAVALGNTAPKDITPPNGKMLLIAAYETGTAPPNSAARAEVTVTGMTGGPPYPFTVF